jgi:Zn-dependent metalloprotease
MAHLVPYLVLFIILNLYEIVSAVLLPERWTSQSNLLQRVLGDGDDGESISSSLFLFGNLGRIEVRASRGFASVPLSDYDHESIKRAAARAIESILASRRILDGDEDIRPTEQDASVDEEGDYHVRLQQYVDGMPVEGSSLMVHFRNDGIIYATNGEVSSSTDIMDMGGEPMRFGLLECDDAVDLAAQEAGIASGSWISDCENAAVRGFDGVGHVAFKRLIGYQLPGEHYQRTVVFANKIDGRLLALHPRTHGEKSLLTYDCMGRSDDCSLRSNSTLPINTPMVSLNAAHNFTIATLDYYMSEFGRDSFDGRGMAVVSYANYGDDYSNAFWDGEACWYGSGDGTTFRSFSLALGA